MTPTTSAVHPPQGPARSPGPIHAGAGARYSTRTAVILVVLFLITVAAAWLRIEVGPLAFGWPAGSEARVSSALADRTTKLIDDVLVGAALAVSGVCLQAVLRNPLAEPFILGLSTGAGVGVMLETLLVFHLHRGEIRLQRVGRLWWGRV